MDRGRWDRGPRFVKGSMRVPQGCFRGQIVPPRRLCFLSVTVFGICYHDRGAGLSLAILSMISTLDSRQSTSPSVNYHEMRTAAHVQIADCTSKWIAKPQSSVLNLHCGPFASTAPESVLLSPGGVRSSRQA